MLVRTVVLLFCVFAPTLVFCSDPADQWPEALGQSLVADLAAPLPAPLRRSVVSKALMRPNLAHEDPVIKLLQSQESQYLSEATQDPDAQMAKQDSQEKPIDALQQVVSQNAVAMNSLLVMAKNSPILIIVSAVSVVVVLGVIGAIFVIQSRRSADYESMPDATGTKELSADGSSATISRIKRLQMQRRDSINARRQSIGSPAPDQHETSRPQPAQIARQPSSSPSETTRTKISQIFASYSTNGVMSAQQARSLYDVKCSIAQQKGSTPPAWEEWAAMIEKYGGNLDEGIRQYTFNVLMNKDPDVNMIFDAQPRAAVSPKLSPREPPAPASKESTRAKIADIFASYSTNGVMSAQQTRSLYDVKCSIAQQKGSTPPAWEEWAAMIEKYGGNLDEGIRQYTFNVLMTKDPDVDAIRASLASSPSDTLL